MVRGKKIFHPPLLFIIDVFGYGYNLRIDDLFEHLEKLFQFLVKYGEVLSVLPVFNPFDETDVIEDLVYLAGSDVAWISLSLMMRRLRLSGIVYLWYGQIRWQGSSEYV